MEERAKHGTTTAETQKALRAGAAPLVQEAGLETELLNFRQGHKRRAVEASNSYKGTAAAEQTAHYTSKTPLEKNKIQCQHHNSTLG